MKKIILKPLRFIRKKWKLLTFLLVVIGLIGLWQYKSAQANKPVLVFEHPVYRDIKKTLEVSGVVDAKEKASMRFAAGAWTW